MTGGDVEVTYNPDDSSTVWIRDKDGVFLSFVLIEKHFCNKTLSEIKMLHTKQSELINQEQEANLQAKIDLYDFIEGVSRGKKAQSPEIKNIRKTRAKERKKHTII